MNVKKSGGRRPGVGRPTAFKPEYVDLAYKFCLLGAIDTTLAEFFEVSVATLNVWKRKHPEFMESCAKGKAVADANVAHSLYKSAIGGHFVEEERLVSDSNGGQEIVKLKKQVEPQVMAQRYWLNNRRPKDWKDKVEIKEEININAFPPTEVLDAIYEQSLAKAAERDKMLIGRRERLGILIEHDS